MVKNKLAIFEGFKIRRVWDDKNEKWWFSVVDVVAALGGSINPRKYWNKLAERLRIEGSEVVTKCHQLKMLAADGKSWYERVQEIEDSLKLTHKTTRIQNSHIDNFFASFSYYNVILIKC